MGICCTREVVQESYVIKDEHGDLNQGAENWQAEAAQSSSNIEYRTQSHGSKMSDAGMSRSVTSASFKEEDVLQLFRKFDANRDDTVSPEELLSVLQQLSDHDGERIDELLKRIDTNGDGLIQLEEFMAWCFASGDVWKKLRWTCFQAVKAEAARLSSHHSPARNKNRISHFQWVEEILSMIVEGKSQDAATIMETGEKSRPLLVVAGACPNTICGMQAIMFSQVRSGVEFWWTKPKVDDPQTLDPRSLELHKEGPHRNTTSKSRALYQPLADKFKGSKEDSFEFGVDENGRAFIDEKSKAGRRRMLLYLVWQENWSSFFAYNKFIEGKLFYQRGTPWDEPEKAKAAVSTSPFFARQYRLEGGGLKIAGSSTEETVLTLLPPDVCQEMFKLDD